VDNGCLAHMMAWGKSRNTISWMDHCMKYRTDPSYRDEVDAEVKVQEGAPKGFNDEEVCWKEKSVMFIERGYLFLTEAEILDLTKCTPKQLGLELEEVPDDTGGKCKGIPVIDPYQPYRRLVCRTQLEVERDEYYMTQNKQLRMSQGRDFLAWARSDVLDPQRPKATRRNTAAPFTLQALRDRGAAFLQSTAKPMATLTAAAEEAEGSSASDSGVECAGAAAQLSANVAASARGARRGGRGRTGRERAAMRGGSSGSAVRTPAPASSRGDVLDMELEGDSFSDLPAKSPGKKYPGKNAKQHIVDTNLEGILDGTINGKPVYQAKRHLDSLKLVKENRGQCLTLKAHLQKANVALMLAPGKIQELDAKTRMVYLATLKRYKVNFPLRTQSFMLGVAVKGLVEDTNLTAQLIMFRLWPKLYGEGPDSAEVMASLTTDSDAAATLADEDDTSVPDEEHGCKDYYLDKFDPLNPRICFMDWQVEQQCQMFLSMLVENLLLTMLRKGEASKQILLGLANTMRDAFGCLDENEKKNASFVAALDLMATIEAIADPTVIPTVSVKAVLDSTDNDYSVMLKAALEEPECQFWPKALAAFRSNIVQSKTLGPKMQKLDKALMQHSFESLAEAIKELPVLKKKMRSGATERLEEKIVTEMKYWLEHLQMGTAEIPGLPVEMAITELQKLVASAQSMKELQEYRKTLKSIGLQVNIISEKSSSSQRRSKLKSALEEHLFNPDVADVDMKIHHIQGCLRDTRGS